MLSTKELKINFLDNNYSVQVKETISEIQRVKQIACNTEFNIEERDAILNELSYKLFALIATETNLEEHVINSEVDNFIFD